MPTPAEVVAELEGLGDPTLRVDLVVRYGIGSEPALGVRMADIRRVARALGTDHDLGLALWDTGIYEARTVAGLVDDPAQVVGRRAVRELGEPGGPGGPG